MSKATKRKHVAKEVLDDYVVPDPNQQIVKVSKKLVLIKLPEACFIVLLKKKIIIINKIIIK